MLSESITATLAHAMSLERKQKSHSLAAVPRDSTRTYFLSWSDIFTLPLVDDRIMELRHKIGFLLLHRAAWCTVPPM